MSGFHTSLQGLSSAYSWKDRVGLDLANNFSGRVSHASLQLVEAARRSWNGHQPFRREGAHEIMRSFGASGRRPVSLTRAAPKMSRGHFGFLPSPEPS